MNYKSREQMTKELKPCPFCGGKAEFRICDNGIGYIICTGCRAQVGHLKTLSKSRPFGEIIEAWNARVGDGK